MASCCARRPDRTVPSSRRSSRSCANDSPDSRRRRQRIPSAIASSSSTRWRHSSDGRPRRRRWRSSWTTSTPPTRPRCCCCASWRLELAAAPILIVGCYRDTEVGPGHPLAEALPELTREGVVTRISLKGLGRAETARLLELTLGRPAPDELIDRVHAETEGNPLFASEIARLLAGEGGLVWDGTEGALPIPQGVKEAIGLRLERQSAGARDVLTLASVLGREFDLEALERVSGLPQDELYAALEEAAAARLVGEVPGGRGRMRFSHVLMRDSIYEAIPATRRPRLHREIAEALEGLYARSLEPHLAELAYHYLAAGNPEAGKAIHYAALAGDRAAAQLAFEEAARHYTNALELLEGVAPDDERRCELLLALGEALSRAGEGSRAKETLLRAAALAESSGRSDQLARAALSYGGRFCVGARRQRLRTRPSPRACAEGGGGRRQSRADAVARATRARHPRRTPARAPGPTRRRGARDGATARRSRDAGVRARRVPGGDGGTRQRGQHRGAGGAPRPCACNRQQGIGVHGPGTSPPYRVGRGRSGGRRGRVGRARAPRR